MNDIQRQQGTNELLFVWRILSKHNLFLNHRIRIVADDTAFKPVHNFTDNLNIIIYGKEGDVWHLRIYASVDTLLIYRKQQENSIRR